MYLYFVGFYCKHLPQTCCDPKGTGKRGHIVADTNVSPFVRARNICYGHKLCVRDTKNVSDFVQKHFVSARNVSQFAQPKKHHEQQCEGVQFREIGEGGRSGNDEEVG